MVFDCRDEVRYEEFLDTLLFGFENDVEGNPTVLDSEHTDPLETDEFFFLTLYIYIELAAIFFWIFLVEYTLFDGLHPFF